MRMCDLFHGYALALACSLLAQGAGSRHRTSPAQQDASYRADVDEWRKRYETSLKQDDSWLTLSGLYWLKQGDNGFGAALGNDIVLPEGSAPPFAGTFTLNQDRVLLAVRKGVSALLNGNPAVTAMPLTSDELGNPDHIALGRIRMIIVKRGDRYGVRMWDTESETRKQFKGARWFPIKESHRVTAQFTSYPQPKMIPILNILGDTEQSPSPGYATFELDGKQCHLEPLLEGDHLFFIFKDLTSGKQTYPAGRFLNAGLPKDGKVVLDFNKATNPPCAFTPYATCPLPPKQNYLPVAVEAGELTYEHAAGLNRRTHPANAGISNRRRSPATSD